GNPSRSAPGTPVGRRTFKLSGIHSFGGNQASYETQLTTTRPLATPAIRCDTMRSAARHVREFGLRKREHPARYTSWISCRLKRSPRVDRPDFNPLRHRPPERRGDFHP